MHYLFSWDEIPGNDDGKLIEFLKQKFEIDWVKTARIEKNDNGNTIKVSTEINHLSLNLNQKKNQVIFIIDDGRTDKFIAKMENSKLNIYDMQKFDKREINAEADRRREKFCIKPDERKKLWHSMMDDKKPINILIFVSIIPNSFVLSYFSVLRTILSEIITESFERDITIKVLLMQDIAKTGVHKKDFVEHYIKIEPRIGTDKEFLASLVELKQHEFASLFNMLLFSFDFNKPAIKKEVKKIKTEFWDLSLYRSELEKNERKSYSNASLEHHDSIGATPLLKKLERKCNNLSTIQKSILFDGYDRAVILELGRVIDYSVNDDEHLILIAIEVLKNVISSIYNDLWIKIEKNTIFFPEPKFLEDKIPIYLNPLSRYFNEENGITSRVLDEYYHKGVLQPMKSEIFPFKVDKIPNKLDEDFKKYISFLNNIQYRINNYPETENREKEYFKQYNISAIRSYEMEVINKGFLTVQEQILQQLSLIL